MIEIFVNSISVDDTTIDGEPVYYYHGDGTGDFERMSRRIKCVKILDDYEDYLRTQLNYVEMLREKETEV